MSQGRLVLKILEELYLLLVWSETNRQSCVNVCFTFSFIFVYFFKRYLYICFRSSDCILLLFQSVHSMSVDLVKIKKFMIPTNEKYYAECKAVKLLIIEYFDLTL